MATTAERVDPVVWIVLALVLLLIVPGALMMSFWGFGMMGGGGMVGTGLGWGLGFLIAMGVLVLILYLVLRAAATTSARTAPPPYAWAPPPGPMDARAVLDARYAKGEISREEYLRMRADLEGRAP